MFNVVYQFADLEDGNHIYYVGDKYPRDGYEPTKDRISELSGENNKIGRPLIKQAKKPVATKKKSVSQKADE